MPPELPYSTTLTEGQLLLRTPTEDDVAAICEAVAESAEHLQRWMAWCTPDYGRAQAQTFINSQPQAWREGRAYTFMIFDRQSGKLLGSCGLNRLDWLNRLANLGYWVRTAAAGQGIASAATKLVLGFALGQLELQRIEIVAAVGNTGSQRVAEKVGAKREALARNRCRTAGVQQDAYIYSIIPEDLSGKSE
ncbi:MAG: GNAT family protein [Pirellulales bacterium]